MKHTILILFILFSCFCNGQLQTPCPSNVTITTNNYSVGLTQSNTYIKISSSVLSSATVKLDANPTNGYVEMNPGFIAVPAIGYSFIAHPLDGCGAGAPSKNGSENNDLPIELSNDYAIHLYPNPTDGKFSIKSNHSISGKLNIYDLNSVLIHTSDFKDISVLNMDISQYPNGVYIAEISTADFPTKTFRIIKK